MLFQFYILVLMSSLALVHTAETNTTTADFGARCLTIAQPLLQDIADKRLRFDQCDKVIEEKDNKLNETQAKLDQIQSKLSIAEALVQQKQRQIDHHAKLCNTHKNNSLIKDELLRTFKTHIDTNAEIIRTKEEHVNKLQTELQQNEQILKNCTAQIVSTEAELDELRAKSKSDLGNLTERINRTEEQMQLLHSEINKAGVELEQQKANLSSKDEELHALRQTIEGHKSQLASSTSTINDQQFQIDTLKTQIGAKDAQLLHYQSKLDMLQLPNCYWWGNSSNVEKIRVPGMEPFEVLCDSQLAGPGWTVIQRRFDGSENFYRKWRDYRNGFGSLQSEFFIGLEKLHRLTTAQSYELYVHLVTFKNQTYFARYGNFRVGSEHEAYELKILGKYSGTAGDGLLYAKYRKFSTYDADHDKDSVNCAVERHGAWWYDRCGLSNLNGKYVGTAVETSGRISWLGAQKSNFKTVQMMLRPVMVT